LLTLFPIRIGKFRLAIDRFVIGRIKDLNLVPTLKEYC